MLKNKLGIEDSIELAKAEEKVTKIIWNTYKVEDLKN